jgi:hypothetical protein
MADRTKRDTGILGVGAAACAACCAPPVIGFIAAASIGTLIGVALFGAVGLAALAVAVAAHLRRRRAAILDPTHDEPVAVTLRRAPDA